MKITTWCRVCSCKRSKVDITTKPRVVDWVHRVRACRRLSQGSADDRSGRHRRVPDDLLLHPARVGEGERVGEEVASCRLGIA